VRAGKRDLRVDYASELRREAEKAIRWCNGHVEDVEELDDRGSNVLQTFAMITGPFGCLASVG
jgi:hypothetical protein